MAKKLIIATLAHEVIVAVVADQKIIAIGAEQLGLDVALGNRVLEIVEVINVIG